MRVPALLAALLLAVPLASANPVEGSFSYSGQTTVSVPFSVPAGVTDLYFAFDGMPTAPDNWFALTVTLYRDGVAYHACASVEVDDFVASCNGWSYHDEAGMPAHDYELVFEGRGSADVTYRVHWT